MTGNRVLNQRILSAPSIPHPVSTVSVVYRSFGRYRTDPRINGENGPLAPYTRTVLLGEADYDAD